MKKSLVIPLLLLTGATIVYSCKKKEKDPEPEVVTPAPAPAPAPTLYERVGGTTMVADPRNSGTMIEKGRLTLRSVVDSAIYVIAGDPTMTPYSGVLLAEVGANNTTGFAALSKNFTDFLST